MLCFPNCKINIGLYITRRRDDGYHDLETAFYPLVPAMSSPGIAGIQMHDVLEIVPAATTALHMSGLPIAGDNSNNLVLKAYNLLHQDYPGKIEPLDIYLHKVIPMGAGLGGGSADGAFMLRLLNDYCGLGLSRQALSAYALQLGSDCPFFIYNTPQFATGRGEQMSPLPLDLSAYSIQLICPEVHVSTAVAFKEIIPKAAPFRLQELTALPVEQWKHHISNDFEQPVFHQHPILAHIKQQLYAQGAIYASMSGSGSALYGIFPKFAKAYITADIPFSSFYFE